MGHMGHMGHRVWVCAWRRLTRGTRSFPCSTYGMRIRTGRNRTRNRARDRRNRNRVRIRINHGRNRIRDCDRIHSRNHIRAAMPFCWMSLRSPFAPGCAPRFRAQTGAERRRWGN